MRYSWKILIPFVVAIIHTGISSAQERYITRTGHIKFYSHAPLEDIQAHNYSSSAIFDITTGEVVVNVLMKSFEFEKALMQEHFNENYVESHKYPKAKFEGNVINLQDINFEEPGKYKLEVKGNLTIHGETNKITEEADIQVFEDELDVKIMFPILLKDYNISIPKAVVKNIAEEIEITGIFTMKPLSR